MIFQKPLRRIQISEIGADQEEKKKKKEIAQIQATQSEAKQKVTAQDNEMFAHFTQEKSQSAGIVEKNSIDSSSVNNSEKDRLKGSSDSVSVSAKTSQKTKAASSSSHQGGSQTLPSVPSTSFQFQSDWKSLKNHPEKFHEYFKVMYFVNNVGHLEEDYKVVFEKLNWIK